MYGMKRALRDFHLALLREHRKALLREDVAGYAAKVAGSRNDFDPALQTASLDSWPRPNVASASGDSGRRLLGGREPSIGRGAVPPGRASAIAHAGQRERWSWAAMRSPISRAPCGDRCPSFGRNDGPAKSGSGSTNATPTRLATSRMISRCRPSATVVVTS